MLQTENKTERSLKTDILEYNYNDWNIHNAKYQLSSLEFVDFFNNFMIKNLPCVIQNVIENWKCASQWVKGDEINYEHLIKEYGELTAPVADCKLIEFNSQCKYDMKVSKYMEYLRHKTDDRILYLKDWHLKRIRPDDKFYETPQYFLMDWLNEFAVDNQEDDFMFVYMGPKGSWTPLHEDVYCSYSWSVNVVGRKKWVLFPPGEEEKLKDCYGNLPLVFEPKKYENIKYFEIIQEKGDALFVPSGWHHQVMNELDTISVNHNWINACNIEIVWNALQKSLLGVEHQIEDCKDTPEFAAECQLILKCHFGMDFKSFVRFLCYIAKKRLSQLQEEPQVSYNQYSPGIGIIKFDLKNILKVMNSIHVHPIILNKNVLSSVEDEFLEVKNAVSTIFH